MEKITILTEPVSIKLSKKISETYIGIKRFLFKECYQKTNPPTFTGPDAVLKSLINGFNRLNIEYNLNPKNIKEIGETVIVLSNIEALKQAIDLKKKKRVKYLLAGPNLVVFSNEYNSILSSPEIDVCIVPSKHVLSAYIKDSPLLKSKVKVWYAGVDENYWKPPVNQLKEKNAVVYYKNGGKKLYVAVLSLLKKNNWNSIKFLYGNYNQEEFRKALTISQFSVFLSKSESQGISLAESWAMDVPTLVWNPKTAIIYGRTFNDISSAPYLSKSTGTEWKKIQDLETILINIDAYLKTFSPRQWVLANMTDIKSAGLILKII